MEDQILIGARFLLAAVFGIAFIGKARSLQRFRGFVVSVVRLSGTTERTARPVAATVVLLEGIATGLLLFATTAWWGLLLATALLTLFLGVIARAVRAGVLAECRCFGGSGAAMSYPMLIRNGILIAAALPGLVHGLLHGLDQPAFAWPGSLAAAAVGVGLALAMVRYYDSLAEMLLVRLAPPRPPVPAGADRS
ncbi:hypothetical protein LWF15_24080 [Kineosporia rhizophila]|uniref:MauE/DoxX family redox-associated membrane protein n=1 Tax=Kineosporia rhizophila TaxID=84633 RepID=UPI001E5115CF|nr:MauE/DoxX family redox-associated membrane protein [Kineosporia rhizophila]MCE0538582.1 hypothetical protein [Kineosporia rhizophila]